VTASSTVGAFSISAVFAVVAVAHAIRHNPVATALAVSSTYAASAAGMEAPADQQGVMAEGLSSTHVVCVEAMV